MACDPVQRLALCETDSTSPEDGLVLKSGMLLLCHWAVMSRIPEMPTTTPS